MPSRHTKPGRWPSSREQKNGQRRELGLNPHLVAENGENQQPRVKGCREAGKQRSGERSEKQWNSEADGLEGTNGGQIGWPDTWLPQVPCQ